MRLDGKVALITGGGRGIGEAIARRFVADGAKVVINDIERKLIRKVCKSMAPGMAAACMGDVTKWEDVQRMVKTTIRFGGKIDILVNNAGIDPSGTIVDLDVDLWKKILNVNLTGPFLCMKAAIPYMIKQGGGSIVNIASLAGVRCLPDMPAYCASKGGLIQLALQAALQYGPKKIRSNVVAPGATATEMLKEAIGKDGLEKLGESIPLGRIADPKEITGACSFLASDDASFVNGVVLLVDGGVAVIDHSGATLGNWGKSDAR
jgi:meso-butanediol dehydrogenase / (S,S)-butanediol dehydrogenase / diacetyl reductase